MLSWAVLTLPGLARPGLVRRSTFLALLARTLAAGLLTRTGLILTALPAALLILIAIVLRLLVAALALIAHLVTLAPILIVTIGRHKDFSSDGAELFKRRPHLTPVNQTGGNHSELRSET